MPFAVRAVLVTAAAIIAALLLRAVLHRIIPPEEEKTAEERAPLLIGTFSATYGLLLGFVLSGLWDNVRQLGDEASEEAAAAVHLIVWTHVLPDSVGRRLHTTLSRYVDLILDEEIPRLVKGLTGSDAASAELNELSRILLSFEPEGNRAVTMQRMALEDLATVAKQRQLRFYDADRPLPPLLWIVLLAGGALVLTGAVLVSISYHRSGTFLIAAVSA